MAVPVFLAIDTDDLRLTTEVLMAADSRVGVKFGPKFVCAHGIGECVRLALVGVSTRRPLFFDLKLHDIPTVVQQTVSVLVVRTEPDIVTLHVGDDATPIRATAVAVDRLATMGYRRPKLLGVTVLSSVRGPTLRLVSKRAAMAMEAGADGLVCPPTMVEYLCSSFPSAYLVVPGTRSTGVSRHDHQGTMTAADAVAAGASALVFGREVLEAPDPVATLGRLLGSL